MPMGAIATVKCIEQEGAALSVALAGESVDVGLTGVDPAVLATGGVLCHPEYPVVVATRIEARVLILGINIPILRGAQVRARSPVLERLSLTITVLVLQYRPLSMLNLLWIQAHDLFFKCTSGQATIAFWLRKGQGFSLSQVFCCLCRLSYTVTMRESRCESLTLWRY